MPRTHSFIGGGIFTGSFVPHLVEKIIADWVIDIYCGVGIRSQQDPERERQADRYRERDKKKERQIQREKKIN